MTIEKDILTERLEKLGYSGRRLQAMLVWLDELQMRRTLMECGDMTLADVAVASMIFDSFNGKSRRN